MSEILPRIDPLPRRCSWELTLACNLNCSHCGSSAGRIRPDELTTAKALSVADQLAELGCREATLLGGEPFIRPDWFQIASRLISNGIETSIISNGLLVDAPLASRLHDIGVNSLGLSIDGLEPTHDHLRGRAGAFRRFVEATDVLQRAGLSVCAVTVALPENFPELTSLASLLVSIGIEYWQIQLPIPVGRYRSGTWLTPNTAKALVDSIVSLRANSSLFIYAGCNVGYLGANEETIRTAKSEGLGFWTGCYAGVLLVAIRSNGDVTGCLTMPPHLVAGNLSRQDLSGIWANDDAFAYNRRFDSRLLAGGCASCEQGEICRGGCRTMSYYLTTSLHSDPCCELLVDEPRDEFNYKEEFS